jgi:hypothetical protein
MYQTIAQTMAINATAPRTENTIIVVVDELEVYVLFFYTGQHLCSVLSTVSANTEVYFEIDLLSGHKKSDCSNFFFYYSTILISPDLFIHLWTYIKLVAHLLSSQTFNDIFNPVAIIQELLNQNIHANNTNQMFPHSILTLNLIISRN